MALPWGAIGSWLGNNAGTLINAGMSIYGANAGKKATERAVQQATPTPYSGSSMFGTTQFDPKTKQFSINPATNPFSQMFNTGGTAMLGNAYSAPGSAYYGAAPEIVSAANALHGPAQDAEAADRYSTLTQLAAPESRRMFQRLEDNLFARGQMGTSGGGEHYRGYYEAQNQADLQRQLASQDWAQQRALSRFQTAQSAVGTGMQAQNQNYNIGAGSFGGIMQLFQNLLQQGNMGVGAGAGTPGAVALAGANAQTRPLEAGLGFLNESGAFDALGRWIGSKYGTKPSGTQGTDGIGLSQPQLDSVFAQIPKPVVNVGNGY